MVLVAFPPMSALAVPPFTVPANRTSVGIADGHFEGVTTVGVEVPVVVFPVFHTTLKVVPVEFAVTLPLPPVTALLVHPETRMALAPAALFAHVTMVGAVLAANAEPVGTATAIPAGMASDAVSARKTRRMNIPPLRPGYLPQTKASIQADTSQSRNHLKVNSWGVSQKRRFV